MKKGIIASVLAVVAIVGVAVGVVVNKGEKKETPEQSMFSITTPGELEDYCNKEKLRCENDGAYYTMYDVSCFDQQAQFCYIFEDDTPCTVQASVLLFGYQKDDPYMPIEYTEKQLNEEIHKFLNAFCEMHGTSLDNSFFVFEGTQLLDNDSDDTYKKIKEGTAQLEFSLRDINYNYWIVKTQKMNDGAIFLIVNKYSDTQSYAEKIPNIDVSVS